MKHVNPIILAGLLLCSVLFSFSLLACAAEKQDREEEILRLQGRSEGTVWSLVLKAGPYLFSDRIPFELTINTLGEGDAVSFEQTLRPADDIWGDFRIRRLAAAGTGYRGELIPRRTGECSLVIPVFSSAGKGSGLEGVLHPRLTLKPDMTLTVDSVLDQGEEEPSGLIPDHEGSSPVLPGLIIFCAVLITGMILYFLVRKRSTPAESPGHPDLETFLGEHKELGDSEDSAVLYRTLFRLLLAELEPLHPGLRGRGYGPLALMAVLEEPSSLNQWNLRSLYPLLERMQELFYAPDSPLPNEREYREHRALLDAWFILLKEDKHEL